MAVITAQWLEAGAVCNAAPMSERRHNFCTTFGEPTVFCLDCAPSTSADPSSNVKGHKILTKMCRLNKSVHDLKTHNTSG